MKLIHRQMQFGIGIGHGGNRIVVQLQPQTGSFRRDDITVVPFNRAFDPLHVGAIESAYAFQNQKVGRASGDLDIGGGDNRAAIQMRCNLHLPCLGHASDLLRLKQAADTAKVHL